MESKLGTPEYPVNGPDPAMLPDGRPRPLCPHTHKPLMAEREANWHGHFSAMQERSKAEANGSDPAATSAVVGAAAASAVAPCVGGYPLQPLSLGTLFALQAIGSVHARENPDRAPMAVSLDDIAVSALIFAFPDWCYTELEAGRHEAVRSAARRFSMAITAPVMRQVNEFIEREMAEFFGPEATVKKPDWEPSPRPAPQMPSSPSFGSAMRDVVGNSPSSSC